MAEEELKFYDGDICYEVQFLTLYRWHVLSDLPTQYLNELLNIVKIYHIYNDTLIYETYYKHFQIFLWWE